MSVMLSKEAILAIKDIVVEKCDVPEWGGFLYVKTLSAKEKEAWEGEQLASRGKDENVNLGNVRASLAAITMCDENGVSLFTVEDVTALNEKSVLALDRVFDKARKLNRIGTQDMTELTKNSAGTPAESSGSV